MSMRKIIADLIESGMSEGEIADHVGGITQSTINRIKTGYISDPKWKIGAALTMLHMKRCRRKKRPFNVRACG